jgi:chaperonin GroEL
MKEKKARVEDALHATRAAVEEGVVPGGGVAFLRCLPALEKDKFPGDEDIGRMIVLKALESPIRQISENAGREGSIVVQEVKGKKGGYGYNAETDVFEDLVKAGVIDPTKVTRIALQNASSIAGLLLTTEALVAEIKEEERHKGGGPPPHYGEDMY